jgi:hypothetical protein
MNSSDLATVMVPIMTALIGVLGVLTRDWRDRRSSAGRRRLAFDDATRQVSFAEQWWKASQAMNPAPELINTARATALSWLDEAHTLVASMAPPAAATDSRGLIRRLLLLYPFQRWTAQVLRVIFYVLLAFMTLTALIALGNVLSGEAVDTSRDSLAWQLIISGRSCSDW